MDAKNSAISIIEKFFPGQSENISAQTFLTLVLEKGLEDALISSIRKAAEELSDCEPMELPEGLIFPDNIAGPIT